MCHVNSDIAYDHGRKRILDGAFVFVAGFVTNVDFGVSRTLARDALGPHQADGLVTKLDAPATERNVSTEKVADGRRRVMLVSQEDIFLAICRSDAAARVLTVEELGCVP